MRLGLDARTIYAPQARGIGRSLLATYRALAMLRPDWVVEAYHRQSDAPVMGSPNFEPHWFEMPGDRLHAWERWRLPIEAWRRGVDVLHCPANTCPDFLSVPTVVTIHDLIPLEDAWATEPAQARRFERGVRRACRKAAAILTPSQYTRGQLLKRFEVDPQRVRVCPWAADPSIQMIPELEAVEVLHNYLVHQPYVLHFGAAAPRKNTARLIDAWAMIERNQRQHWQLLIVGLDDATQQTLRPQIERLNLRGRVLLHGFAPAADLSALLSAAQVLAFPSLAEGFGLPVLEAFATGTAVLTSNLTSLPEVAGDAAVLIDPHDPCAIARGLTGLMRDTRLREEMVARGWRRLQKFSWQQAALSLIDVFETVTQTRSQPLLRPAA